MEYLLHIETSGACCSVCVSKQGNPIDTEESKGGYHHAEILHTMTRQLLGRNRLENISPAAVSVGSGPGSYTGMRIGVAFAKGLCMGYGVPLLSVSSLAGQAFQARRIHPQGNKPSLWMPMTDARRMEVYTASFSESGEWLTDEQALVLSEEFVESLPTHTYIYYFGDGAHKAQTLMQAKANTCFIPDIYCSAYDHAALAWEKWKLGDTENTNTFDPSYLKEFIVKKKVQK